MKHLRTLPLLCLLLIGCGTSASYKYSVKGAYPLLADRLEKYSEVDMNAKPLSDELRAAATDPVTYEKASDAWQMANPVFRTNVMNDTKMPEFTRAQWIDRADDADELNMEEAKRRSFFFLPP